MGEREESWRLFQPEDELLLASSLGSVQQSAVKAAQAAPRLVSS